METLAAGLSEEDEEGAGDPTESGKA
jgi:hypothetical protein